MPNIVENIPSILTFAGIFVSFVYGPKILAKIQIKAKKEEVKAEEDVKAEGLYLAATERQYNRYEIEIKRIEMNFDRRINEMEKEFKKKFDEINGKYNHLLEEKSFLEKEIESRDDRIDELEEIIASKNNIIASYIERRTINEQA